MGSEQRGQETEEAFDSLRTGRRAEKGHDSERICAELRVRHSRDG